MRIPILSLLVALLSATALVAPTALAAAPAGSADEVLPSEASIGAAVAPLSVTGFEVLPPQDGWDARETFQLSGGSGGESEVPVLAMISASALPTGEGAAGFLQAKVQQYRDATRAYSLDGQLGPAGDGLTLDADEAYCGAFVSPDGAAPRLLTAVHVARYENVVTAVETTMVWDSPGTIDQDTRRGLGTVLSLLATLVNAQAP